MLATRLCSSLPAPPTVQTAVSTTIPRSLYFVDQVRKRSHGALRIEVAPGWGGKGPDAEQQVVRDVAAGTIELGWVGTSVFDTLGDTDFQALTAPMLIDSNPLQRAVLDSDIPAQMLAGLDRLGVQGLAVLGDGLRKPIAVNGPLLRPDDYRGITFSAFRSAEHVAAIAALGAIATDKGVDVAALRDGAIDGFEKGLRIYEINGYGYLAPYVTANVNLWPYTVALIANPDTLSGLTKTQRGWLTDAAIDAETRSTDLTDDDPELLVRLCAEGSRLADASPSDLAAMRDAFAPEYETLRRDPTTKRFIDEINSLKGTTDSGREFDIPADCTGRAATTPASSTSVVAVASPLDGTYRWTITAADALAHGTPGDKTPESQATFPSVFSMTMNGGHWTLKLRDASGSGEEDTGIYTVEGEKVNFHWNGNVLSFAYTIDSDGTLHLAAQDPMDPGDKFVWSTNPWTKIDSGTASATVTTALDGTYRWTITKDDALAPPSDRFPGVTFSGPKPEEIPTFPWIFTMTMNNGNWILEQTSQGADGKATHDPDGGHGTYTVTGDHVVFLEATERFDYKFTVDPNGTLHLEPQPPISPGPAWVFATNSWTKIN